MFIVLKGFEPLRTVYCEPYVNFKCFNALQECNIFNM